jgi:hypothetical protein
MITNVSQLADAVDFLFPPHVLADPFTCLSTRFSLHVMPLWTSSMTLFSTPSQVTTVHLFLLTNHPNLACQSESCFSLDMLKEADEAPSDAPEHK